MLTKNQLLAISNFCAKAHVNPDLKCVYFDSEHQEIFASDGHVMVKVSFVEELGEFTGFVKSEDIKNLLKDFGKGSNLVDLKACLPQIAVPKDHTHYNREIFEKTIRNTKLNCLSDREGFTVLLEPDILIKIEKLAKSIKKDLNYRCDTQWHLPNNSPFDGVYITFDKKFRDEAESFEIIAMPWRVPTGDQRIVGVKEPSDV